jgi:hypothetical protein
MSLTPEERSAINKANAAKSTGPKTRAGKMKSRQNALQHGLTAEKLALPTETDDHLQAHMTAWNDALEPKNFQEDQLVQQATLASLRIERFARAENAILTQQIIESDTEWDREQKLRCVEMVKLIQTDPAVACVELKSFVNGLAWLLSQWLTIRMAFQRAGCLNNLDLVKFALRLQGYDPDKLALDRANGFEFVAKAIGCIEGWRDLEDFAEYFDTQIHPTYFGRNGVHVFSIEDSKLMISQIIDKEIEHLEAELEYHKPIASQSRIAARDQALILHDTPKNKLFLRYARAAEQSLEKAVKTLAKLQADRKKAEKETPPAFEVDEELVPQLNEPNSGPKTKLDASLIMDLMDTKSSVMPFAVGKPPQMASA